jgi:hypothetical protein
MTKQTALVLGDILALAVVTVIGFATHGESGPGYLPRMLITFIPLAGSWFLSALWLGLFDPSLGASFKQLWRIPVAMLLAAPLAGVIRAALLGGTAIPVFVLVLGATSAAGLVIWRGGWMIFRRR